MRAYGWGTKIYGKPDGEMWRREDPKRKEEFKNPLFELNAAAELIKNALKRPGDGEDNGNSSGGLCR